MADILITTYPIQERWFLNTGNKLGEGPGLRNRSAGSKSELSTGHIDARVRETQRSNIGLGTACGRPSGFFDASPMRASGSTLKNSSILSICSSDTREQIFSNWLFSFRKPVFLNRSCSRHNATRAGSR